MSAALARQPALPLDLTERPANAIDPVDEWLALDKELAEHGAHEVRVREGDDVREGVAVYTASIEYRGLVRWSGAVPAGPDGRNALRELCRGWCRARGLHVAAWGRRG